MKPDDIILGQFYVIEENTGDEELERFLQGTNRVVKIVRRADYTSKRFIAEHYGFPINSEWIKRWVPGVGELAEFSDNKIDWYQCIFAGYSHGTMKYPMRIDGGEIGSGYKYARPVQKKATPVPDRNQTFEPAELEAMQEEAMLESIESHKPEITVVPDPEQPRYAALKKRLIRLERFMADINDLHKNTGGTIYEQLRCLKNEQETAGANMLVLLQELTVRMEALEAKDEDLSSWQKRFGDAVDRLTARMNLIFDKVNKL